MAEVVVSFDAESLHATDGVIIEFTAGSAKAEDTYDSVIELSRVINAVVLFTRTNHNSSYNVVLMTH